MAAPAVIAPRTLWREPYREAEALILVLANLTIQSPPWAEEFWFLLSRKFGHDRWAIIGWLSTYSAYLQCAPFTLIGRAFGTHTDLLPPKVYTALAKSTHV